MRKVKTLKGRCGQFLDSTKAAALVVFGADDVKALEAFVLAEIARGAEPEALDCPGVVIGGKVIPFDHLAVNGHCARCGKAMP